MRERTPTGSTTGSSPKTRTEPFCAASRPRMCLISVVLPAPLAPTRPYTTPRGTVSVTSFKAILAPNRRVTPVTAMTVSFMCTSLLCVGPEGSVALTQEVHDLVAVESKLAGFGNQGVNAFRHDAQPFPARQR